MPNDTSNMDRETLERLRKEGSARSRREAWDWPLAELDEIRACLSGARDADDVLQHEASDRAKEIREGHLGAAIEAAELLVGALHALQRRTG